MTPEASTSESELVAGAPNPRTERLLQFGVALAIAVLGAVVVWEARDIRVPPIHSRVGPRVFPYLVGSGLIVVGLWLAIEAATGRAATPTSDDAEDVDVTLPPDWRALGLIGVGLALYWYLIERAGFVIASALLFYLAALGMGSRYFVRNGVVAVALSLVLYVVFTEGLNLRLPAGWLDFLGSAEVGALGDLANGFEVALTPEHLFWALVGVLLGTAVGVLPGIGPALTVALLLPVTYDLEPISAFIMFAGIYYGGMYGGSTTSILLNTPGESASIITALEGNKMARRGRGAAALATAAVGSFVAGTIGTVLLTLVAPWMVDIALKFGEAEYFALIVLAFMTVSTLLGTSVARGLASLFLGLAIGLVGIDTLTGQSRFAFGVPQLLDGVDVVTVAVGLFAVGETLWVASRLRHDAGEVIPVKGSIWMTKAEWRRSWKPWLRGAALGFPIGSLPAGGAEIPTFLSYATEKRLSQHPEEFGQGAIEGVAGPEAANNASAAGVLVPLLTLGLPTSATAAILLVAFQRYGLNPGAQLFDRNPDLVWGLIASLYIGNVMLLVLNLPLVGLWVRLLAIPRPYLYAGILVFAGLGTYSLNGSPVDLVVLYTLGVLGYLMRRFGFPVAPAVVGVVLGPEAEDHFRRALQISQGDYSTFVTRPLSLTILILAGLAVVVPIGVRFWRERRGTEDAATE